MYCYPEPNNHFASFNWSNTVSTAAKSESVSNTWKRSDINTRSAANKPPACYCFSSITEFTHPVTAASFETQAAKYQTFFCPESTVDITEYEAAASR
jgi:hypothetical protein